MVGAKKEVKVTVSRNIGTSYREEEIDRQKATLKREGLVYDLVTLKDSLELTSYQDEPVEIAVTKSVGGELLEMTGEPVVCRPLELKLKPLNPSSVLRWTVTVAPGETKMLEYTYNLYVN